MEILKVRVDSVNVRQALEIIKGFLISSSQHQIATVNPEFIVDAQTDSHFRKVLNSTSLNTVDGFGIKLVGWFRKQNLSRCPGVDLIQSLFTADFINQEKIFLLGGRSGVAYSLQRKLQRELPNLQVVGAIPGFTDIDNPTLVEYNEIIGTINKSEPSILLVAYNAPFAQTFIAEWLDKMPSVKVAIGVGGSFDFLIGRVKRAPRLVRILGLEWLWRLILQPSRVTRIYKAVFKFLYLAFKENKITNS